MENFEILVRGFAISSGSPVGLGLPRSVNFQGLELLWVVIVATIVLAVVSVTRVNVVTWGTWSTNKSEGGHVRVRVHGAIVTAGGMFSAEIVNCSADSCSEDASSSDECSAERAEMLFIFDQKGASLMATTTKAPAPRVAAAEKRMTRALPAVQEILQLEATPHAYSLFFPRLEGIEWDASPAIASPSSALDSVSPAWASAQAVCPASRRNSFTDWDPLLKLRIRDAVLSDGSFARSDIPLPRAPVAIPGSTSGATLKDDVVRVWDCDSKTLVKSVHLSGRGRGACARVPVSSFDVDWESKVAAMSREGGVLSLADLECGAYQECYQTQQSVVQAIHLDRASSPNAVFTGGPLPATPGCSVSLWDSRSSNRELTMNLSSAVAIYGISAAGHALHVRDEAGCVATHDVRMLGASPVSRLPCDGPSLATQDRWWDIDTTLVDHEVDDDDDDDDDDWFDCLSFEEIQTADWASSYMTRSFVRTLSRNFSIKA